MTGGTTRIASDLLTIDTASAQAAMGNCENSENPGRGKEITLSADP